jgi:hypothetical protein
MFGSNILEVAVGVVFVYLLLSLVCTVINEGIASIINQRGKILIAGIQNLLNDGALSGLAQQLYNHGLVVGISENVSDPKKPNGLPSYISPSTFALSLLDLLRSHGANIKEKEDAVTSASPNDPNLPAAKENLQKAKKALSGTPVTTANSQLGNVGTSGTLVTPANAPKLGGVLQIAKQLEAGATEAEQILAAGRDLASKYMPWDSIKTAIAALPNKRLTVGSDCQNGP